MWSGCVSIVRFAVEPLIMDTLNSRHLHLTDVWPFMGVDMICNVLGGGLDDQ